MSANTPRAYAIRSLLRWERDAKFLNLELDAALSSSGMTSADNDLFAAIVMGVCERKITLDAEIERLTGRGISALDAPTAAALRVGLYQIYYMDRVPPHAAVNETVSASPSRSKGLVNAALRRALREGGAPALPENDGGAAYLSAAHSLPIDIVESFMRDYPDDAEALCADANRRAPTTIRTNTLRISPEALLRKIESAGIEARANALCPDMIDISGGGRVDAIPGYGEGMFFVEDASSRFCVEALGARAGDTVVDVCAAPGGKSFSCAIDMNNEGRIYAFDLHENKLGLIRRGARRLGIDIISVGARDAKLPPKTPDIADCVLCDAPCSGLGVIAKKPDIRYKRISELSALCETQYAILSSSSLYVRRGGVLVYSTCTQRRAENEDIVNRFLSEHGEFRAEPFGIRGIAAEDGMITLMAHRHGCDGFFIAKMRREGGANENE